MLQKLYENRNKLIFAGLLILLVSVLILIGYAIAILRSNTFYDGIYVENIDVSGMSRAEARKLIEHETARLYNKNLVLTYYGSVWTVNPNEISFKADIDEALDRAYSLGRRGNFLKRLYDVIDLNNSRTYISTHAGYDEAKLTDILYGIKQNIDCMPKNAKVEFKGGNILLFKDEKGRLLDIESSKKTIEQAVISKKFGKVELTVKDKYADIIYSDIENINGIISSYTTTFDSSNADRTHNIKLSCGRINNIVLKPGEVFSMNKALGSRTLENGYKEAKVIFKNEFVNGVGGGVCQVTTTLYNAVLKSRLKIIQRRNHSLPLSYVSPGQDATIAEDYIDFRFKNNKAHSIVISSEVSGSNVIFRILGKKDENEYTVKLKSVIIEEYFPEGEDYIVDNTIPDLEKVQVRKAINGCKAILFRETYDKSGKLIETEKISEDVYKPVKPQYKVNQNFINGIQQEGTNPLE